MNSSQMLRFMQWQWPLENHSPCSQKTLFKKLLLTFWEVVRALEFGGMFILYRMDGWCYRKAPINKTDLWTWGKLKACSQCTRKFPGTFFECLMNSASHETHEPCMVVLLHVGLSFLFSWLYGSQRKGIQV